MPPFDIEQPHSILLCFIFIFLSLLVSLLPLRFSSSIYFGIQVNISLGHYKETGVCIRLKLYNARKNKFEFYNYNNLSSFNYMHGLYLTLYLHHVSAAIYDGNINTACCLNKGRPT